MNSTINFIYFLNNHKGLSNALVETFGEHLGNHFFGKLEDGTPASIIKLIGNMTEDNQEKFLEWIDKNYSYKKRG